MKQLFKTLRFMGRLYRLRNSATWVAAAHAVDSVMSQKELTYAAQREPQAIFCPMCGQVPDGDRRMDHARKIAMEILRGKPVRRHELDASIALCYFARKR